MKKNNFFLMIMVFAIIVLFASCNSDDNKQEEKKYIYVDLAGVVHSRRNCDAITKTYGGAKPLKRFMGDEISTRDYKSFCKCVNDEQYEAIILLSEVNDSDKYDELDY